MAIQWELLPALRQDSTHSVAAVRIATKEFISTAVCSRIRDAVLHFAINHKPPGETLSHEHLQRCSHLVLQIFNNGSTSLYSEFMGMLLAAEQEQSKMTVHKSTTPAATLCCPCHDFWRLYHSKNSIRNGPHAGKLTKEYNREETHRHKSAHSTCPLSVPSWVLSRLAFCYFPMDLQV